MAEEMKPMLVVGERMPLGRLKSWGERGAVFRSFYGQLCMVLSTSPGMTRDDTLTSIGGKETTAVVVLEGEQCGCTYFYQDTMEVALLSKNGIFEMRLRDF